MVLKRAHYKYLIDDDFGLLIQDAKAEHERYITEIIACDVFPQLEKVDPLKSQEEDEIPAQFGKKWFQYPDLDRAEEPKQEEADEEKKAALIMEEDAAQLEQLEQSLN